MPRLEAGSKPIATKLLDRWTLCTLLGVALFQVWAAQHYTVFDDEAFSCRRYALPLGQMVSQLHEGIEPDPPLFYIAENLWVHSFGVSPLALRSLPILIFLAGLIAIRAAGTEWFDRRTGIAAMLLSALHPAHLFFGMSARWYGTMFTLVATLLWLSARITNLETGSMAAARPPPSLAAGREPATRNLSKLLIAWTLVATAILYTNYFGVVLVTLIAMVAPARKKTLPCLIIVAILFAPWLESFWRELHNFPPQPTYIATAQRTFATLLAGNLADNAAWWVWTPMALFALAIIILLFNDFRRFSALALITIGTLVAAIASRTMIDKYIMAITAPAVLLAAAIMFTSDHRSASMRKLQTAAIASLCIAWLACGANLIREKNWSSLRWLDPFEKALAENWATHDEPPSADVPVMSHSSPRYYVACRVSEKAPNDPGAAWLSAESSLPRPENILAQVRSAAPPQTIATMETTGFTTAPAWRELLGELAARYSVARERQYLEDPQAAEKNRIDPRFTHPRWRITVRRWIRKPI